jgi:hypothetical protein
MPMDFSTFITQLNDAIVSENGPNLAYLLRPTSPHGKELVKEFRNPTVCGYLQLFIYLMSLLYIACFYESI